MSETAGFFGFFKSLSTQHKSLLLSCYAVMFSQYFLMSFLSPFFPQRAEKIGVSESQVGLIFGIFPVGTVLGMPFIPRAVKRFGHRRMVEVGLTCSCLCALLFGLVESVTSDATTATYCWVFLRILNGFCGAFAETGMLALVSREFSNDLGKVLAVNEVMTGLGTMLGPPFGGYLYSLGVYTPFGQFMFPFIFMSVVPMLIILLLQYSFSKIRTLSKDDVEEEVQAPCSEIINVQLLVAVVACAFSASIFDSMEPSLPPRMALMGYDESNVGSLFMAPAIVYVFTSYPVGTLVDLCESRSAYRMLLALGFVSFALAFTLLNAPAISFLSPYQDYILSTPGLFVSLALIGFGSSLTQIPVLPDMQWGTNADDDTQQATVCAIWGGFYASGSALGPLATGYLLDIWDFSTYCTVCVVLAMSMALLTVVSNQMRSKKTLTKPNSSEELTTVV